MSPNKIPNNLEDAAQTILNGFSLEYQKKIINLTDNMIEIMSNEISSNIIDVFNIYLGNFRLLDSCLSSKYASKTTDPAKIIVYKMIEIINRTNNIFIF